MLWFQKLLPLVGIFTNIKKSVANPTGFWANIVETFYWRKKWDTVLEWDFQNPKVEWFKGGKLNITENIFERNLFLLGNQVAIIWEPNDPKEKSRKITYSELFTEVQKFANVLKRHGVRKRDWVALYMPMIPEISVAMLACARIGAIHSVVFAGFSAKALAERIVDAEAKVLVTADGGFRAHKTIGLKAVADEALKESPSISSVIVVKRTGQDISWDDKRDYWWHDEMESADGIAPAEIMDSEDPLYILYTSGSTGRPKGVLHTIGGYMVYTAYTFRNVFQYSSGDVFFCAADIGWVTGHSYIVYGPLLEGATSVMFEGIPTYPDAGRYWDIIKKHKVNQFYTSPTAIRLLIAQGQEWVQDIDLTDTLRVLGTVGEPINEEAWHWYHDHVGSNKCPIVDTWWQTETGGIMISAIAGVIPTKPAFASLPLPGIQPQIVNPDGKRLCDKGVQGNLCIKFPWPGMARTHWGDHNRYVESYFSQYKGLYFTGDGVKRDEDGYYRILGRMDDVINVSVHRLGTAEIENAINEHPLVSESAVVGFPHEIRGQGIFAYVVCTDIPENSEEELKNSIKKGVSKMISPIARPDQVLFVSGLPKTRSGKIMRRILKKIATGSTDYGDISTLTNPEIVREIVEANKLL